MPAQIETGLFCASYFAAYRLPSIHDGKLVGEPKYIVDFSGGEGPAHCTCPAFAHFKGPIYDRTCKHIDWVFQHACMWNCQWHEGNPPSITPTTIHGHVIPGESCPNCNGPVVAVRIAV